MSTIGKYLLAAAFTFYVTYIFFLRSGHFPLPTWLSSYAADLLCMPLILSAMLLILRFWKKVEYLSISHILASTLYVALSFEYLLPRISTQYVSDPYDVLCYGIGALVFLRFQKGLFLRFKAYAEQPEK